MGAPQHYHRYHHQRYIDHCEFSPIDSGSSSEIRPTPVQYGLRAHTLSLNERSFDLPIPSIPRL